MSSALLRRSVASELRRGAKSSHSTFVSKLSWDELARPAAAAASSPYVRCKSSISADEVGNAAPETKSHGKGDFVSWDGLSNGKQPALVNIPSYPIVGSVIPQLSGIPSIDPLTKGYKFWRAMRNKYGEFYTMGNMIGGNRNDIYRTAYIINDPREYVKIIRAGGKYPSGVLEILWVNKRWSETRGMKTAEGIHGRGEEWRRIRTFLQTDLLHPEAARGYLPGIIHAASLASKGAKAAAELQASGEEKALNAYLNRCAFDMFSSMMFGIYTETADVTTPTDPENDKFVKSAVQGLGAAIEMLFSPYQMLVGNYLGIETKQMKHCFEGFDSAWKIAQEKIGRFIERKERGELAENEQVSYLSRALDRQKEEGSNVSLEEVRELAFTGLFAAVDTTSAVLGWNLFHTARLPEVQEKLYKELSNAVQTVGNGQITAEVLSKQNAPYLHAIVRETQRITPTSVIYLNKSVDVDNITVHGRKMDEGDVVLLEGFTIGMNPDLVEDPDKFRPERWLTDAVEARKGSPSEVIDHPFLSGNFSQGARKCPGSRVAMNEIQVLLSQLILDWKISLPVSALEDASYRQETMITVQLPRLTFEPRE